MNFTNTIKLAIEGLKKATVNLSDKEKREIYRIEIQNSNDENEN